MSTPSQIPPAKSRELPIGIFDSGIGGLTVAREIHRTLPHEDLVYLGDTARVPYGTKSPNTVIRYALEDTRFLLTQNVKAVVVACNTASAWALSTLQRSFPVPVIGVILPGVRAALSRPAPAASASSARPPPSAARPTRWASTPGATTRSSSPAPVRCLSRSSRKAA